MPDFGSVAEALHEVGLAIAVPPMRPSLVRGPRGTVVPIALLGADLAVDWRGCVVLDGAVRFIGAPVAGIGPAHPSGRPETDRLVALVTASALSLLERAEEIDERLTEIPISDVGRPAPSLEALHRSLLVTRRHTGRLGAIVAELGGPLAPAFPGIGDGYAELAAHVDRVQRLVQSAEGTLRDIVLMRTSAESNRISETANRLGEVSNRVSSLANNSNVRMLGIAYLALIVALIGAVFLIPETVATILSMPSATYVNGDWVSAILLLSAAVPLAVIFTRPWMIRILRGLASYEARSQEGIDDIPETTPSGRPRPGPPGVGPKGGGRP